MSLKHLIFGRLFARTIAVITVLIAAAVSAAPVPDFCFIHAADSHLTPQPVGAAPLRAGNRTADGLVWFASEAAKPQIIPPLNLTTPPPAFIIVAGDLTEYGVIHKTWDNFEALLEPLDVPFFVTPGNHDNTWTGMMHVMRDRHGSDHYSFDQFGCHFASINTATPQEPVPSIEQRTLTWLIDDLRRVPRETPIFVFCHHPLSSREFAKPFEQLRLLRILDHYNVVLLMMGHGHSGRHERWNTIDSVMGGTTSHPKERIGYNVVIVKDGILRVAHRLRDESKPVQITLEKPLEGQRPPDMTFVSPRPVVGAIQPSAFAGNELPVKIRFRGHQPTRINASVNAGDDTPLQRRARGLYDGQMDIKDLGAGMHFLLVTAEFGKQKYERAEEFLVARPDSPTAIRTTLTAGVKAAPLVTPAGLIVATTSGEVLRVTFDNPRRPGLETLFQAGVEILHPPALADGRLYLPVAEKGVCCLNLDGSVVWSCEVGAVVYGTPALDADRLYVGDLEGFVHAIDRHTGELIWSKRHATFSIEMPVLLHRGVVYAGAWDNQVYAINATDGSLKWKKPGPAAQSGENRFKSRYYGPADCPPVAIGDRLFVTDRAYQLGAYHVETGEYLGNIASSISAIGPAADAKGFYARGLSKGLTRYDAQGKAVWSQADVPFGRFPAPPAEAAGKVFACSNRGTLSVHNASDGGVLFRYQATPHLHVMAPVAADAEGAAYVAGMDGSLTRVLGR